MSIFSLLEPPPPDVVLLSLRDFAINEVAKVTAVHPRYLVDSNMPSGHAYLLRLPKFRLLQMKMPKFSDRWVRKRPRTDDMAQMLDDLGIEWGFL